MGNGGAKGLFESFGDKVIESFRAGSRDELRARDAGSALLFGA
jgi:hypothetical protein